MGKYLSYLFFAILLVSCSQTADAQFELTEVYPNVKFTDQVEAVHVNDRLYVVAQRGIIYWLPGNNENASQANVFLDISDKVVAGGERGLLGLAFHPDFRNNGYFYINYTTGNPLQTRISRFTLDAANPAKADPGSELVLLTYIQPYSNHNGGKIAFGPDGFLYISAGDGGSGGDPQNNAQNRQNLLGKIMRIDVDNPSGGRNYGIPADNPFASNTQGHREEIYAYGLRNVWKFSFDNETERLWAADVGQNAREEINIIEKGGNYGWRIMEGVSCYNPSSNCDRTGLILPVFDYAQGGSTGRSITGGFVYRGSQIPSLKGKYIYGDYVSGNIWALELSSDGKVASNTLLLKAGFLISSFGVDQNQELLVLSHGNNRNIYRLTDTVTGLEDAGAEGVEVFPNPGQTKLQVNLNQLANRHAVKLSLYNAIGQLALAPVTVKAGGETQATLNIAGLARGVYTLRLEAGE